MTSIGSSAAEESVATSANPFAAGAAHIDGAIVPIDEARIPITDMGFARSDLTYDVVAVWSAFRPRRAPLPLRTRLQAAPTRSRPPPRSDRRGPTNLVRCTELRASYVDMICTRGVPAPGARDPRTFRNRFYAYAIPYGMGAQLGRAR